jgi:molybdate transport system permease protein
VLFRSTSDSARDALWLSLRTSAASTALCLVLGVPLATLLARRDFAGKGVLRALVLLPLILPPVVGGLALLYTFGRRGLLGHTLQLAGIEISFTTTAVVLAQTFVALPFLVLSLEGTLATLDRHVEEVAATLGASPTQTFTRITLPAAAPGVAAGTVLAFARALGEFGATITFAGSLQGTTTTLPIQIYLERVTNPESAVALSLVLVVTAIAIIATTWRAAGIGSINGR